MTRLGSIVMYSWGLISGLASLVHWLRSTSSNNDCLTAMGLVITTLVFGFAFILQALTRNDQLSQTLRNQRQEPEDGSEDLMRRPSRNITLDDD